MSILLVSSPPSDSFIVEVSDNDQLVCFDSMPPKWRAKDPTAILVHGIGGSSDSKYILRHSAHLYSEGNRVIRINFRGCGAGEGMARKPSHAGRSCDLLAVCEAVKSRAPKSPLIVIGYSLGGNILLKMLGEEPKKTQELLRNAIAICPVVDLYEGSLYLGLPEHRFFEKMYLKWLLEKIARKRKLYHDYPQIRFPNHCRCLLLMTCTQLPYRDLKMQRSIILSAVLKKSSQTSS